MSDARDIQSVIAAAERAAAAGDLAAAEASLREAARLQEATLGPSHADLAQTFNNLAIACEMANKAEDAERFYRRAYAVAESALAPDDPLVATSRDNLREFCAARGLVFKDAPSAVSPGSSTPSAEPARDATVPLATGTAHAAEPAPASAPPRAAEPPGAPATPSAPAARPPAGKPAPAGRPVPAGKPAPAPSSASSAVPRAAAASAADDRRAGRSQPKRTVPAASKAARSVPRPVALSVLAAVVVIAALLAARSFVSPGGSSVDEASGGAAESALSRPESVVPDQTAARAPETPASTARSAPGPASAAPGAAPASASRPAGPPPPAAAAPPASPSSSVVPASPASSEPARRVPRPATPATLGRPAAGAAGSRSAPQRVAQAELCSRLSTAGATWRCDPPADPAGPGAFFFSTRVTSPINTSVEHRWYRDGRLRQSVELAVRANRGPGYRTYSRQTITRESVGEWRVEVRSADGAVLAEERFVVR